MALEIEIEYVVGDATAPKGTGPRIVAHICSDAGGWGKGFGASAQAARGDRVVPATVRCD
ncbi:MAG TPA: hypothetical protein VGZ32_18395 [Actinocrinis sp.]|uniref:hypothetical protein n=1 Tax=Actinocrinis sp. TaxID=1920516 RepID=UPI002DDD803A|nr:hypothetical protein [Actinocrinis sp.]HEV3172323.1 hypothetical protein [Actinocrinis sp.]